MDIAPTTVALLRRRRSDRAGLALQLAAADALVFGSIQGEHQHPNRFSRAFAEAQRRCRRDLGDAAPPRTRLHDLRHAHATILLSSGVPVHVIAQRLGHASPTITLSTYAHVLPGGQAEAAAAFDRLLGQA